jgi:hypothetical protein
VKAASAVICGDSSWIETQVLGMRGRLLALQDQSLTNTNFMQGPQLPVYIKSGGNYVKSVLLLTPLVQLTSKTQKAMSLASASASLLATEHHIYILQGLLLLSCWLPEKNLSPALCSLIPAKWV